MLSQLFILSSRGDTLVDKDYRCDGVKGAADTFLEKLQQHKGEQAPPVLEVDGSFFVHIKCNDLYFVCIVKPDVSPFTVLEFLLRVSNLCKDYCGVLNEEAIRLNFALVYELLDEVMDFGCPQNTSTEALKAYIQNDPVLVKPDRQAGSVSSGLFGADHRIAPSTAANKPISASRQEQLTRKNEIFVDVIERLTVLIAANGNVVRSEIDGSMQMKSFLVGSPKIKLGLNEEVSIGKSSHVGYGTQVRLDSINFHQSVNLEEFDNSKIITVHPPEGEFTVLKYHISGDLPSPLPFQVFTFVEEIQEKGQLIVQLKIQCDIPVKDYAVNIVVRLPVPKSTTDVITSISGPGETAEYKQSDKIVYWKIKKIQGSSEVGTKFMVTVGSCGRQSRMELGPISVDFEIPMYVLSHLQLRFLRVFDRDHSYVPLRWVRYVTHSDSYVARL
ncbi:AP-4 complex subunit mu-1-like [Glandiceps talaboti]